MKQIIGNLSKGILQDMIEPKLFYRELDSMLSKIAKEESGDHFFATILTEVESKFGQTLAIMRSHVFEQRGEEFVRIHSTASQGGFGMVDTLSVDSEVVQEVLDHGSYIYDQPEMARAFARRGDGKYCVPSAISISSPDGEWILVFELKEGWNREEITLFLNALRTAINYRLYTDRINTELERVAQIQRSLLPKSAPRIKGYRIAEYSQPALIVGGDFYEYIPTADGTFILSMGDASGHGLPAALLVRDVVIGLRMGISLQMRLVPILKKLNQVIQGAMYSTNFVSLFIGEIEEDGHLAYINAGHPPPFVVTPKGIVDLETTGIALGFLPEISLRQAYVQLEPDSLLVLYTDGIIERQNAEGEQFGIDRLKKAVMDCRELNPKEIVQRVFDAVDAFGNRTSWEDDASLLVIQRIGPCVPTKASSESQ